MHFDETQNNDQCIKIIFTYIYINNILFEIKIFHIRRKMQLQRTSCTLVAANMLRHDPINRLKRNEDEDSKTHGFVYSREFVSSSSPIVAKLLCQ